MRIFVFLCCFAFASAATIDEFQAFKTKFQKADVNDVEDAYRMKVFSENLEKISKHNEEASKGMHTFTLGVNKFADLTIEEWRNTLTLNTRKSGERKLSPNDKKIDIPDEVDWRKEGYVTPVKD